MQLRLHVTREAIATGFTNPSGGSDSWESDSLFGSFGRRVSSVNSGSTLLPLMSGRPNTDALMEQLGREAGRVSRAGRGIAVVCCGPRPMVKEVGRQVLAHSRVFVNISFQTQIQILLLKAVILKYYFVADLRMTF